MTIRLLKHIPRLLTLLLAVLLITACEKEDYSPIDTLIPTDFDFATTRSVGLQMKAADHYKGQYFYQFEVFDQIPFTADTTVTLLTAGVSGAGKSLQTRIIVPTHLTTIFVRQTDPQQRQVVRAVQIEGAADVVVDFSSRSASHTSAPVMRASSNDGDVRASDYTLPVTYETLTSAAFTLMGGTYFIPAGVVNSNITMGWLSNSSIYIAGELHFPRNQSEYIPAGTKIVVLPGGTLSFNSGVAFDQANTTVAVHEGAEVLLGGNSAIGNSSRFINDGNVTVNANFEIRQNSLFVNNSSLTANLFTLTNSARMVNNAEVVLNDHFVMNSSTSFINNGTITTSKSFITNNNTSVVENNGHITALYLNMSNGGGQLINNCSIEVEDFGIDGGTVVSAPGTIISSQDFSGNNATITLNGNAIFEIKNKSGSASNAYKDGAEFLHNVVINGVSVGADIPLVTIWKITYKPNKAWQVLQLNGNLELAVAPGQMPPSTYFKAISAGVSIVQEASVVIPASGCNNGGVNVVPDAGPEDPTFPILVVEGNQYTFAMEDLWPHLGDYDMNDFVFRITNIKKSLNQLNQVLNMSFDITPLAAGSTKSLTAALQFDGLPAGAFTMTSTHSSSRVEEGQEKANVVLFEGVHSLFGLSKPVVVNTFPHVDRRVAQTHTFTFDFKQPVLSEQLTVDKLNFYMIVGEVESADRVEIHLANFAPSSKVRKPTRNYKDANNMVWAIMLPVGDFKYPTESTKIFNAYPAFNSWAESGGTNDKSWYLTPADNSNLIYSR